MAKVWATPRRFVNITLYTTGFCVISSATLIRALTSNTYSGSELPVVINKSTPLLIVPVFRLHANNCTYLVLVQGTLLHFQHTLVHFHSVDLGGIWEKVGQFPPGFLPFLDLRAAARLPLVFELVEQRLLHQFLEKHIFLLFSIH